MKTQHTPGPWVAEFLPPASSAYWFVRNKDKDATICHVERGKAHSKEQQAADARLIAAAPELLAALGNVLPMAESLLEASQSIDGLLPGIGSRLNAESDIEDARAALAKAKGEL